MGRSPMAHVRMPNAISEAQWGQYDRDGYLNLGPVLSGAELDALRRRIDEIMLGTARLDYRRILMQLDSDSGKYEEMKEISRGHKGETLEYRKIQDLEFDP